MDKRKQTNLNNYGVEHYNNYNKIKQTNKEKYGNEFLFKIDTVKEKSKNSMLLKYGVEYASQSKYLFNDGVKLKIKQSSLKPESQLQKSLSKRSNTCLKFTENWGISIKVNNNINNLFTINNPFGENFDIDYITLYNRLKHLYKNPTTPEDYNFLNPDVNLLSSFSSSGFENEVADFIKTYYNDEILLNYREFKKELDIYLPKLRIGFECNGTYWHSSHQKSKDYHINKTEWFNSKDIKVFHIHECDWKNKKEIIKSMILNQINQTTTKIYARKCIIKSITPQESKNFLINNHLQGNVNSKIKLGLYYNNELISIMTFGNLRKNLNQTSKEGVYELLRFCTKLNTTLVGGASKLLKHFEHEFSPQKVISYANIDYSQGKLYENLNFILKHQSKPGYFYIKNNIKYNRFTFRKQNLIKLGYDKNLTESKIMNDLGYYAIYDCGVYRFEKEYK